MSKLKMKGTSLDQDEQIERVGIMLGWATNAHERGEVALMWRVIEEINWIIRPMANSQPILPLGPDIGTDWHLDRLREQLRKQVEIEKQDEIGQMLQPGAIVPVDIKTTGLLVQEIIRLRGR